MRRAILLLLALGCDDPAVGAKALDILEAALFADGSVMASVRGAIRFHIRGTADALTFKASSIPSNVFVETADGEISLTGSCQGTFDVETVCDGFNLAAFGVE